MSDIDVVGELRRLPLFSALTRAHLEGLCRSAHVLALPRSAPLYRQGDRPHHLFVLLGGRVKVTRQNGAGREMILDLHAAPAILGEFAAYTARPHLMTAVALEPCTVVLIPRRILRGAVDASAPLAAHLLTMFQERYEHLSAHIEDLAGAPVERRLASLLVRLRWSERYAPDGKRVIPLALTRCELAGLVATTTETVVRLLTRWKATGTITTRADGISVTTWEPIERLALGVGETLEDVWSGTSGAATGRPSAHRGGPPRALGA
jgi:CRP-like cAMP-binding protein